MADIPIIGPLVSESGRLLTFLLATSGFAFLFSFMPNTRVQWKPALLAALLAAAAWLFVGWIFSILVVSSGRYAAIYSAFAGLVLFMLWVFASWVIVLVGAKATYILQHPDYIVEKPLDLDLSLEQEELLALRSIALIGRHFYDGKKPWTRDGLASHLQVPWQAMERGIDILIRTRFVQEGAGDPPTFVPGRPLEDITVATFLESVRRATPGRPSFALRDAAIQPIAELCREARKPMLSHLEQQSLKDLAHLIPSEGYQSDQPLPTTNAEASSD